MMALIVSLLFGMLNGHQFERVKYHQQDRSSRQSFWGNLKGRLSVILKGYLSIRPQIRVEWVGLILGSILGCLALDGAKLNYNYSSRPLITIIIVARRRRRVDTCFDSRGRKFDLLQAAIHQFDPEAVSMFRPSSSCQFERVQRSLNQNSYNLSPNLWT